VEPWLLRAVRRRPDHPALVTATGTLSYAELYARAVSTAAGLRDRGVAAGDRVAVALPPGEAFALAVHGAVLAGAVVVPIDLRLTAEERARRVGEALVVEEPIAVGELRAPGEPAARALDDPAAVMFTSGTTSAPRPVVPTHGNWLASALGSAAVLGLDLDERWLCPMPPVHVGGLSVLVRSAIYATTAVLHERYDTDAVLGELMDPARATTLVSLVPTMLARLLDAGLRAPPALRWALLGGGPIAPALLARAAAAEVPVAPTYGMTEACSQIATHGWPLPGVELMLAPDGEILVRGATVSPGALTADGWLHTGDLGRLDERGRLSITGRKADTIVTGGENVAPTEVEEVLLAHPAVADAGVFARPDAEWGEAIVARVVLRPGADADADALRAHCATRLARFKVPKVLEFTDALPRTASGKLLRRVLV
jgi:o-succinylbenzoate---CoA ligase